MSTTNTAATDNAPAAPTSFTVRIYAQDRFIKRALLACLIATDIAGTVEHSLLPPRDNSMETKNVAGHLLAGVGAADAVNRLAALIRALAADINAPYDMVPGDGVTVHCESADIKLLPTRTAGLLRAESSGANLVVAGANVSPVVPSVLHAAAAKLSTARASGFGRATSALVSAAGTVASAVNCVSPFAPDGLVTGLVDATKGRKQASVKISTLSYNDCQIVVDDGVWIQVADILQLAQAKIPSWPKNSLLFLLVVDGHPYAWPDLVRLKDGQSLVAYGTAELSAVNRVMSATDSAYESGSAIASNPPPPPPPAETATKVRVEELRLQRAKVMADAQVETARLNAILELSKMGKSKEEISALLGPQ